MRAPASAILVANNLRDNPPDAAHDKPTLAVPLGDRLLPEEHFEFRGGWTRGRTSPLRTRAYDANSVEPRREAAG